MRLLYYSYGKMNDLIGRDPQAEKWPPGILEVISTIKPMHVMRRHKLADSDIQDTNAGIQRFVEGGAFAEGDCIESGYRFLAQINVWVGRLSCFGGQTVAFVGSIEGHVIVLLGDRHHCALDDLDKSPILPVQQLPLDEYAYLFLGAMPWTGRDQRRVAATSGLDTLAMSYKNPPTPLMSCVALGWWQRSRLGNLVGTAAFIAERD